MISVKVRKQNIKAFTLVELLMALMVTSIILTTVLILAFAMTTANESSDNIAEKQAKVRHTRLIISDLIRQCRLVCGTLGNDLAIWKSDDDNDNKIDVTELVYIETGDNRDYIKILEFLTKPGWMDFHFNPDFTQYPWFKVWLKYRCRERYVTLIDTCSNTQFLLDTTPPETEFVSLSFDLQENGVSHHYQINTTVRCRAGHLLDSGGQIVSDDD